MENEKLEPLSHQADGQEQPPSSSGKKPWHEPKLTFVEPKLTEHGSLEKVTGEGFFGGFSPK
jgi:hypothetical protein